MRLLVWIVGIIVIAVIAGRLYQRRGNRKPVPAALRPGKSLPAFQALDEKGNTVLSSETRGSPAVFIFVRGSWCPFCSAQVEQLTSSYKEIVGLGARLILITPKPLATTRRVADFFKVDFEFWLDESLNIADRLGLRDPNAVPGDYQTEYGDDTVWPTSIVVDANGIIRYTELSRAIIDRPDPQTLLRELKKLN